MTVLSSSNCIRPSSAIAHAYRAYHSSGTDLRITAPLRAYSKGAGPANGAGYNGYLDAGKPNTLAAEVTGDYKELTFYDWNQKLGTATQAPWQIEGIQFKPGLHVLFVVGTRADGSQSVCKPALGIAK